MVASSTLASCPQNPGRPNSRKTVETAAPLRPHRRRTPGLSPSRDAILSVLRSGMQWNALTANGTSVAPDFECWRTPRAGTFSRLQRPTEDHRGPLSPTGLVVSRLAAAAPAECSSLTQGRGHQNVGEGSAIVGSTPLLSVEAPVAADKARSRYPGFRLAICRPAAQAPARRRRFKSLRRCARSDQAASS